MGSLKDAPLTLHLLEDLLLRGVSHVLPEHQDARIEPHLEFQGGVDEIDHGFLGVGRGQGCRNLIFRIEGRRSGINFLAIQIAHHCGWIRRWGLLGRFPSPFDLHLDFGLQLFQGGFGEIAQLHQFPPVGHDWVPLRLGGALFERFVEVVVVGEGMGIGADDLGAHEGRALALPDVADRLLHGHITGQRITTVQIVDHQQPMGLPTLQQGGYIGPGVLHRSRCGDGVAVVLDEEEHRQFEVHRAVDGLPEFPFGTGAFPGSGQYD